MASRDKRRRRKSRSRRSSEWKSSPRVWNFLNPKMKTEPGSMKISVMSYNVLSQQLLEDHQYLYKDCLNEYLDWSARGPALVEQIIHHRSDIVCLQEIQEGHWKNFFQPRLTSYGYKGFFVKRSGSKPDGCAILYKGHKFALVESVPVNFLRNGLLDRDNVGLILLLRPRSKCYSGQVPKICVATTHLLFNPKRGDVKLAQLMLFLAEIEKHSFIGPSVTTEDTDPITSSPSSCDNSRDPNSSNEIKKHPYCPVILCGDFNLEPNSPIYDFITKGYLRYDEHTSPELSGQKEGRGGSFYSNSMPRQFLPTDLGINDHCQYSQHVLNRQRSQTPQTKVGNILTQMNSGQAWHEFQFKSVYSHSSVELVTTHHNLASCTVDYIFHSSGETMIQCQTDKGDRKKRKRRESSSTSSHKISSNPRRHKTSEHKTKESISRDNDKDIEQHQQRQQPQSFQNYREDHNSKHSITIKSSSEEEEDACSVQIDSHLEKEIGKNNIVKRERPAEKVQNSAKADCYKKVRSLEVVSHWSLLSSKEMERYNCLPNHIFPSDHTCLIGEFVLH